MKYRWLESNDFSELHRKFKAMLITTTVIVRYKLMNFVETTHLPSLDTRIG